MDATRPGGVFGAHRGCFIYNVKGRGGGEKDRFNSPPLDQGQSSPTALDLFDSVDDSVSTRKRAS